MAALAGFDIAVEEGQTLTLLGPSGCGKTTALRVIAGFERPDAGTVRSGECRWRHRDSMFLPRSAASGWCFRTTPFSPT